MSAFRSKVDIPDRIANVRFWHKRTSFWTLNISAFGCKADIPDPLADVG
jgi:hypothetical protein